MKIRPVGAELFHEDRRTDMTRLIVAFRNFVNAPKNALFSDYGKESGFLPGRQRSRKSLPSGWLGINSFHDCSFHNTSCRSLRIFGLKWWRIKIATLPSQFQHFGISRSRDRTKLRFQQPGVSYRLCIMYSNNDRDPSHTSCRFLSIMIILYRLISNISLNIQYIQYTITRQRPESYLMSIFIDNDSSTSIIIQHCTYIVKHLRLTFNQRWVPLTKIHYFLLKSIYRLPFMVSVLRKIILRQHRWRHVAAIQISLCLLFLNIP